MQLESLQERQEGPDKAQRQIQTGIGCQLCELLINHDSTSVGSVSNRQLKLSSVAVTASPKVLAHVTLSSGVALALRLVPGMRGRLSLEHCWHQTEKKRKSFWWPITRFHPHPTVKESLELVSLGLTISLPSEGGWGMLHTDAQQPG